MPERPLNQLRGSGWGPGTRATVNGSRGAPRSGFPSECPPHHQPPRESVLLDIFGVDGKVGADGHLGDANLIAAGERTLNHALGKSRVEFRYYQVPLVETLPLPDESQHLVICSEVVEHLEAPQHLLRELSRILKPGGFLMLTTDNSPNFLQRVRRIPVRLRGKYRETYTPPSKESVTETTFSWQGREYHILGHINLQPTRHWEQLCRQTGFEVAAYGTYESIRRGGGSKSPLALAAYFAFAALVYYLIPRRVGRFFGDTTALLLRKPADPAH
jgi:SAM-dependent methyltransferase